MATVAEYKKAYQEAKQELGGEMAEFEFKKIWTTRNIKRELIDTGFIVESHRNKNYIKPESLNDLLPRLINRYNIKSEELSDDDDPVDNSLNNPIDNSNDNTKLDTII